MNKKAGQLETVELQELVSQPQCLKLLILHTPFSLNLSSLPSCKNLVKLDLSRNNLSSFPYLGHLQQLKFLHIHENKLDIDCLISIFTEDISSPKRSPLSQSIVWVTFYGNKNQFAARHYLATSTSVIAVDHNIVVQEERSPSISQHPLQPLPLSPATRVSELLGTRKFNRNASEEEYMREFWNDMQVLRGHWVQVHPILKIQKVWRGWSQRNKLSLQTQQKQ